VLPALFRQRPAAVDAALARTGEPDGAKLILEALGAAGTPASVGALGRIARDRARPVAARVDALGALVHVQRPSVDAMRIPLELVDDADPAIRRAARLMTGALARAGRGDHPAEADALDAALASRLAAAREPAERASLLAALGNSAGRTTLAAARAGREDPSPDIRVAALEALRLSDDPSVDALLAASMTGDPDARVRGAAIFAASFRPAGSWLAAACQAAAGDPAEQVRAAAVSLLRKHLGASPEIAETLRRVSRDDARPGVRRLAREALERGPPHAVPP
jgi:hypothetical protein